MKAFPFVVQARCFCELAIASKYFQRFFVLRLLWRVVLTLLTVICYLGVVGATAALELLPFQILKWAKANPASRVYWGFGVATIILTAAICCLIIAAIYRNWRARRIDIDLFAVLIGSLLAVWEGFWVLPQGWQ
jgi:uncharacterized BrkB/YihY/UPF0761 family membrane protein